MRTKATLLVLLFLTLIGSIAVPAFAQEDETLGVEVKLSAKDGEGVRQPVVGAHFDVTLDGETIGSGETDADGVFFLEVDGFGNYEITLDPASLPEGVTLTNPDRNVATAKVEEGRNRGRALFALETVEGAANDVANASSQNKFLQLTLDGTKLGLFLAMGAIGLNLIYGTTGLTSFAHSEMIVFGMLTAYMFNYYGLAAGIGLFADWGLPGPFGSGVNLIFAGILATIAGGLLGWCLDVFLFAPMRRMGVSLIAQMIVTIGLSLLMRYFLKFLFGGDQRFFKDYTAQSNIDLGIVGTTPKDLISMLISLLVLGLVGLALVRTRMGKAMRAVSDNRDLAESSGIDVQRVIRLVWVAGGALAALGGIMLGLSDNLNWLTGFRNLLLIFAGVTLGGLGTAYGALVGCLIVGIGVQLSTLIIPAELKNAGALLVMVIVLMFRPQGILGKAERIG